MSKHHFRKPVKAPERKSMAASPPGGNMGAAPSGDGTPFIPPAAGGTQPQTPPMGSAPMTNASRMAGRYGAQSPDDGSM